MINFVSYTKNKTSWITVAFSSCVCIGLGLLFGIGTFSVYAGLFGFGFSLACFIWWLWLKLNSQALGGFLLGTVFFISTFLYSLPLVQQGLSYILYDTAENKQIALKILWAALLGFYSFIAGYMLRNIKVSQHISKKTINFLNYSSRQDKAVKFLAILLMLSFLLGYVYLILVRAGGFGNYFSASYGGRYVFIQGLGWVAATHQWFVVGLTLSFIAFYKDRQYRWLSFSVFLSLLYMLFFLLIGQRSGIIVAMLSICVIYVLCNREIKGSVLFIATIIGWPVAQLITILRAFSLSSLGEGLQFVKNNWSLDWFVIWNSDFSIGWQNNWLIVRDINYDSLDFRLGMSYLEAFIQIVPRAIFPSRPLAPAEWFVLRYHGNSNLGEGSGFAFTMLGEAYWNLGLAGVIAIFFLTGLTLGYIDKLRLDGELSIVGMVGYANLAPLIFFLNRSDFATFLKQLLILGVSLIVLRVLTNDVGFANKSRMKRALRRKSREPVLIHQGKEV